MMKPILLAAAMFALGATSTAWADPCTDQADAKKLSGAARTSFVKKCTTDMSGTKK